MKAHVTFCGYCSRGFASEDRLREHQKVYAAKGGRHDGEPWQGLDLTPGMRLVWEPYKPKAFANIEITEIAEHNGEVLVASRGEHRDVFWNSLDRFAEACFPEDWERRTGISIEKLRNAS